MIKKDWVSDRETELLKEAGAFLGEPFQNKIDRKGKNLPNVFEETILLGT